MAEVLVDPKMALVTGASGGIGEAISQALVAQDFFVHGVSSKPAKSAKFLESIGGESHGLGHVVDLANPYEVNKWSQGAFPDAAPGIVIHAAGITYDRFLFDRKPLTPEDIDEVTRVMNVNAIAPYIIESNFGQRRRKGGGAVLHLSSISYHEGNPKQGPYAMSKGALEGLMRVGSHELGGNEADNARINALALGPVNTDMWNEVPASTRRKVEAEMRLKRAFTPGEAAEAAMQVLFGTYREANGMTFVFDGGLLQKLGVSSTSLMHIG